MTRFVPGFCDPPALGSRRLHILLCREGVHMNHKRLRRLYAEERLQVRRRGERKRALETRAPMTIPQGPNQRLSLDFVSAHPTSTIRRIVPNSFRC